MVEVSQETSELDQECANIDEVLLEDSEPRIEDREPGRSEYLIYKGRVDSLDVLCYIGQDSHYLSRFRTLDEEYNNLETTVSGFYEEEELDLDNLAENPEEVEAVIENIIEKEEVKENLR